MQGEELRELRRRLGLTQVELSDLLGVDQGSVSRWERGRGSPRPRTVRRLRDLLLTDDHRRANARLTGLIVGDLFSAAFVDRHFRLAQISPKGVEHYRRTREIDARGHLGLPFLDHCERIGNHETGSFFGANADLLADCVMMRLALNIRGEGSVIIAEPVRDEHGPNGFVTYRVEGYEAEPTEDIRLEAVDVQCLDDPTRFQPLYRRTAKRRNMDCDHEKTGDCIFLPFHTVGQVR